jgi:hypothetical protein
MLIEPTESNATPQKIGGVPGVGSTTIIDLVGRSDRYRTSHNGEDLEPATVNGRQF